MENWLKGDKTGSQTPRCLVRWNISLWYVILFFSSHKQVASVSYLMKNDTLKLIIHLFSCLNIYKAIYISQ